MHSFAQCSWEGIFRNCPTPGSGRGQCPYKGRQGDQEAVAELMKITVRIKLLAMMVTVMVTVMTVVMI